MAAHEWVKKTLPQKMDRGRGQKVLLLRFYNNGRLRQHTAENTDSCFILAEIRIFQKVACFTKPPHSFIQLSR